MRATPESPSKETAKVPEMNTAIVIGLVDNSFVG
jgi:hypothetical protein